jgi:hypothetical protein
MGVVENINLKEFKDDVEGLSEGAFVKFKTSALLPPIYLNAYLAVLHANTLAAIFPESPSRRVAAKNFAKKAGPNARTVFALQPYALANVGTAGGETRRLTRKPFVYLLPITAQLLSSERSLLKYGGGKFTVVGKMVRRFPEGTRKHTPAYVDSATLETWEQAIRRAPGELLCRTAPNCADRVRAGHLKGRRREWQIDKARRRILSALVTQTSIPEKGAVILPVAIYK